MAVIPFGTIEADESDESDEMFALESDEADEAAPRRFGAPIRTPGRGNNVPPRAQPGFATRAELTATANRLDAKIGTLTTGVKTLETRVRTLDTEQTKLRADLKKEAAARQNLTGQMNNLTQISMLLPLLSSQSTVTTNAPVANIPANTSIVVDSGDKFTQFLPILLMSGMMGSPGNSGSSSGGMFGDNNSAMMLAMFFALSK
jgi:outer membrane murein-binding lipoprotein Lpp